MAKLRLLNFRDRLIDPGIMVAAIVWLLVPLMTVTALGMTSRDTYDDGSGGPLYKSAVTPNRQLRVHRVSNVNFSITNYGILGSQGREEIDSLTGESAPSCEFPAGTGLEYLFQGSLWIGAIVERTNQPGIYDTLVSIGNDGWWGNIFEMYPATPPNGNILMLSKRGSNAPPYADSVGTIPGELPNRTFRAVSEQDFVAIYYDTNVASPIPDPNDGRAHRPLGLRIVQKSYSWSYEYAEDFLLIDFEITNIYDKPLENVWIGLYVDADVWHIAEPEYSPDIGAQNDICGYLRTYYNTDTQDTMEINTAYIADDNGRGLAPAGIFSAISPRGVTGVRVVRAPQAVDYGFNWWISNTDALFDWGPMTTANQAVQLALFGSPPHFPGGGKGTPGGDRAKYFVMSAGEFDYDQIYCNVPHAGWIPNTAQTPADLANGYDTRYLYSFGPFDSIPANGTLPLTIGYVCGDNFHIDPRNYEANLENSTTDTAAIRRYYNNLNFRDFTTNAQWAEWVYDNPGRDSCYVDGMWVTDGNRGLYKLKYPNNDSTLVPDTFWYKGDGCPDFQGPPPPPPPKISVTADKGVVQLDWYSKNLNPIDGVGPEDFIDPFSRQKDFEGYAIYFSFDAITWTLLARYDKIDFVPVNKDTTVSPPRWVVNKEKLFAMDSASVLALDSTAIFGLPEDTTGVTRYWIAQDFNLGLDTLIADSQEVDGEVVRHYRYIVDSLPESRGIYFSVTAFDFGNPQTSLSPLESAKSINAALVYPIRKSDPVMVYPNPYKISNTQYYIDAGYEDPERAGWAEQSRRIWFSNLPDNQWAIVRIWTLDGDLVRAVNYDPRTSVGNPPGTVYWDLISRNTQAVVSGLYLYSIEYHSIVTGVPDKKSEIGKFAIIK